MIVNGFHFIFTTMNLRDIFSSACVDGVGSQNVAISKEIWRQRRCIARYLTTYTEWRNISQFLHLSLERRYLTKRNFTIRILIV